MEIVIQFLAAGGPFALTLMGIIIAVYPPKQKGPGHWIWFVAFLVVGLPTVAATYLEMRSSDQTSHDTNQTVHALQDENKGLHATLEKVEHSLGLDSGSPLVAILRKIEALTPHTMNVTGGGVFNVPAVSGEVSVHTIPKKPTKIILPIAPYQGERLDIIDSDGNASGPGAIAVYGNGHKIDGYAIYYLPFARQSITVTFDGHGWGIN